MKLYKYVRPHVVPKMFGVGGNVLVKCSTPDEFNDPYELFLTLDFDIEPNLLAFYEDVVGRVVQAPTACFSRSPDVVPMWAHYGSEGQGAVIELDEDCLLSAHPELEFGDVAYREGPDPALNNLLKWAATTLKFRHSHALQTAVLSAAYFTKASPWSYERERRMVVPPEYLRSRRDRSFLVVDKACITGVIAGPQASPQVRRTLRRRAGQIGCTYYQTVIGKLTPRPYFKTAAGPYTFDGERLLSARSACEECGEPLGRDGFRCSWCSMGDEEREAAAAENPLRLLAGVGLLEDYRSGAAPASEDW